MNLIPDKLYKQIVDNMPLVCVDVVLMKEENYVLVKRADNPLKGEWWVVGGRIHKGETILEGAHRKVLEETGLEAYNFHIVGIYEDFYPDSSVGVPTHSVSVVVTAEVSDFAYKLDKTSSEIGLFTELPHRFSINLVNI